MAWLHSEPKSSFSWSLLFLPIADAGRGLIIGLVFFVAAALLKLAFHKLGFDKWEGDARQMIDKVEIAALFGGAMTTIASIVYGVLNCLLEMNDRFVQAASGKNNR